MFPVRSTSTLALALCLVSACAPRMEILQAPPAVPGVSIQVWTQELAREKGKAIYAKNYGDRPLRITLLHLYNCQNVTDPCGATNPDVTLAPGESAALATLRPVRRDRPYNFQYSFQWKEVPPSPR